MNEKFFVQHKIHHWFNIDSLKWSYLYRIIILDELVMCPYYRTLPKRIDKIPNDEGLFSNDDKYIFTMKQF